jgi:PEP-CTERM motif
MKRLLYAASALGAVALAAPTANAAVLFAGACVPGSLAVPCVPAQEATGPTPLLSLSPTSVGNFSISGSALAAVSGNGITFNSQTIQVSTTGTGGLVDVFFSVTGVPTQQVPLLFMSTFTSNQQNATTHSVIESTYENNNNSTFGLGNLLGSATLNNALLQTAGPIFTTLTPGGTVSFVELYQIELLGCGTQPSGVCTANLTIDLSSSAVPEPASLALMGVGLLGLGFVTQRKRSV